MNQVSLILAALFVLSLAACDKGSDTTTVIVSSPTNSATSVGDIKKIVTVGAGINFNNLTGGYVAMALHPTLHAPAIVYYDRTQQVVPGAPAGALKFASMDSLGNWSVEIVDSNYGTGACGSATAYCIGAQNIASANFPQTFDIAYIPATSTVAAYPMVVYAQGNNTATGKRIRSAVRNPSTGRWSITDAVPSSSLPSTLAVTVIEHPLKGLRLIVDNEGRPHLYFGLYETVSANSRLKYTMRKTDGTWTALASVSATGYNFVNATFTYNGTSGLTQSGGALCPASDMAVLAFPSSDNTPTTTGGANQPWILRCTAVDTAGTCTAWAGLDLITGCAGICLTGTAMTAATTNAGNRSDLSIDPTTGKVVYGVYSTTVPTTQTVTAVQASADTCSSFSTTAWTTQAFPTASQGVSGFRMASSNANALMFSTAAAGASTQVHRSTFSPLAAWTTANTTTVETAAASLVGGFAFDSSNSLLWGAYSVTTAGAAGSVGNDVKVFASYESDIATPGGIANTWTVDQSLSVFPSTAAPVLDAGIAPNGTVGYTYFYTELGTTGPNSHLYYGVKGGPANAPVFGEKIVYNSAQGATTNLVGQHPSLTYDSGSNPLIAFYDAGVSGQGLLMLAHSSNGGVSFAVEKVDGATTGNNVGTYSSVQIAANGNIGISYYDTTNFGLKFAKKSPTGAWRRFSVDGPTGSCAAGTTAGAFSRLRWTSANKPIIAYQATISGVKYLRLAFGEPDATASTYAWTCMTVDSTGQASNARGEGIDFALDSSDRIYIAHQDSTVARIRYLSCDSTATTCSAEVVESVGSIVVNQSRPAIALDSNKKIYIAYYNTADQGLYLKSKESSSTTSFQYIAGEAIEVPVDGALYTNPAGQYADLVINSANGPMIFYRSLENWVKFFSRE